MKIVVLDGHTLNPGDLDWATLQALADCTIYPRTRLEEVTARLQGAGLALTNKCLLGAAQLACLPELRYIGVLATGYNVVDVVAAAAHGIVVTNVPAYGTRSVAQHVFALILEMSNRVGTHAVSVAQGRWARSPDWCYWDHTMFELQGRVLGIIGYGRIGQTVADLGRAFGMRVLIYTRRPVTGVECVPLEHLLESSDVVSLHCPLTNETQGLINAATLAHMKPTAFLINTSRGPLLNESDLAVALNAGWIAGAGLDVLAKEPPSANHPLVTARNCIITPHVAWATTAARSRLLAAAVGNVQAFLAGRPQNVVS
jgi:glycerate dehydrogenase